MPKSLTLLLRRWPCWPGPYERLLTGELGRPQMFSPIRRSSLYLALLRFDISRFLQSAGPPPNPTIGLALAVQPGIAPQEQFSSAATASPGYGAKSRRGALSGCQGSSQA